VADVLFVEGLTPPHVPKELEVLLGGPHVPCRNFPTLALTELGVPLREI